MYPSPAFLFLDNTDNELVEKDKGISIHAGTEKFMFSTAKHQTSV